MIHKALEFAALAHKDQQRKGSGVPYIVHPFEVAQILTAYGASEALIVAGLLHDTIEDTSVAQDEIGTAFGEEVLALVLSDSEDKSKTWEQRKQHTVDFLRSAATQEQRLLACADKLSNLRSIAADQQELGDGVWCRFKRGKQQQAWYYRAMLPCFSDFSSLYEEYSRLYCQIFEGTQE